MLTDFAKDNPQIDVYICTLTAQQKARSPHASPATSRSPSPTPRSVAALSRTWVLDSGSAHHIQDKAELTSDETSSILIGDELILETANGDRTVNEHIPIQLTHIGLDTTALAMNDCPSVLSVGQLVQEDGFRQVWDPQLGYLLQDPQGQWYRVNVINCIPELDFDNLERIRPPLLFSTAHPPDTPHVRSDVCWCCRDTTAPLPPQPCRFFLSVVYLDIHSIL